MTSGGETRSYRIFVPSNLGATTPVPLLLSLHGADILVTPATSARNHETETGWNAVATSRKFIVVYPVARTANWEIHRNTQASPNRDVQFLNGLIARLKTVRCINPKRVHIEGYSRGGIMAERMACDSANVVASVAAYAGGSPSGVSGTPCSPSRGIGVGIFQNSLDPVSSLPIGIINRDEWRTRNQCPANGVAESGTVLEAISWRPCARGGVEVFWRLYLGLQTHLWPTTEPDRSDILNRMWTLFSRNPLP